MISVTPFLFVTLLGMVENAVIHTDDTNNRIAGGEDASITEFPSMAYLLVRRTTKIAQCSGTIISNKWILTAGHCVKGALASNTTVTVGSKYADDLIGGSTHRAVKIIEHKEYVFKEFNGSLIDVQNDIALVEVEKPFPLNNVTIKAARLAVQDEDTPEGTIVTAVGWGKIEYNQETTILHKINFKIVTLWECSAWFRIPIDERNLCAADSGRLKGICEGDSGGPLFNNDVLVGVSSLGRFPCIYGRFGNAFTRVASFRHWITQNTGI